MNKAFRGEIMQIRRKYKTFNEWQRYIQNYVENNRISK